MDTVEVASHLFQAFAQDARVLQRIRLLQSLDSGMTQQQLQSILDATSLFAALDVQQQVSKLRSAFQGCKAAAVWTLFVESGCHRPDECSASCDFHSGNPAPFCALASRSLAEMAC